MNASHRSWLHTRRQRQLAGLVLTLQPADGDTAALAERLRTCDDSQWRGVAAHAGVPEPDAWVKQQIIEYFANRKPATGDVFAGL